MEQEKDIRKVFIQTCKSIEKNQEAITIMISVEMSKLRLAEYSIENRNCSNEENIKLLKEIDRTINSLTMYDWILTRKLESVRELYASITGE